MPSRIIPPNGAVKGPVCSRAAELHNAAILTKQLAAELLGCSALHRAADSRWASPCVQAVGKARPHSATRPRRFLSSMRNDGGRAMNLDDTAKFGNSASTIGEHICPQCGKRWTNNKIFCDHCVAVRESYGFWGESLKRSSKKKCATVGCRRLVEGRTRYCDRCARKRKAASTRESRRRKCGKTGISPIGAEALTEPKTPIRYHHPQTSVSDSSFSTALAANTATNAQ